MKRDIYPEVIVSGRGADVRDRPSVNSPVELYYYTPTGHAITESIRVCALWDRVIELRKAGCEVILGGDSLSVGAIGCVMPFPSQLSEVRHG